MNNQQARVAPLHMGEPNAGEFTLVGVPADQLLNRYTRQRGTDIRVLSNDLLTMVLFAVGDIKISGDVRAPSLRASSLRAQSLLLETAHTRQCKMVSACNRSQGALRDTLACRQVCSRWRALSARPVVAAALWDCREAFPLRLLAEYIEYLAKKLKQQFEEHAEHVGGSRDATFLVALFETGLAGGLRAAPADVACMRAVALYFDYLFEKGLSRPGLIVCTPSQMSMWCRALQGDHPDGRRLRCAPTYYAGDEESRMSLLRASPRCTIFIAAFSTITQEQMWAEASDIEEFGSDSESEEQTENPNVIKRSCAYVVDSRVAPTGILLGRNLHEAVNAATSTSCVQLRPLSSTTSFSDGVDEVRSLLQRQKLMVGYDESTPVEGYWLEAADRFSFGDQEIARWGVEDYAGQLLKKMADVFFRIAQG